MCMDTTLQDLVSDALDECKIGGHPDRANALATLAVAVAIRDLTTAVAELPGVDGFHPLFVSGDFS